MQGLRVFGGPRKFVCRDDEEEACLDLHFFLGGGGGVGGGVGRGWVGGGRGGRGGWGVGRGGRGGLWPKPSPQSEP